MHLTERRRRPRGATAATVGMRERVTLFGGTLDAGRADGGGFHVHAVLPLEDALP